MSLLHVLLSLCVVLVLGEQEPEIGRPDWGRSWTALGLDACEM